MTKVKIHISKNVQELIEQAELVFQKHQADGENSVLNALQNINLQDEQAKINQCKAHHLRAEELKRQMELAYRERDILVDSINETIRSSRDLLLGVYRANPKKLGEWGFKVSDKTTKSATKDPAAAGV